MSEQPPIWRVPEPAQPYPDGRFDPIPRPLPVFSTPAVEPVQPLDIADIADMEYFKAEYDERAAAIVEAAADAVLDIETVFRLYGHIQTHPLPNLRALLDLLKPPAPKWTAQDTE